MINKLIAAISAIVIFIVAPAGAWIAQTNRTCPGGLGDTGTSYTFYWGVRAYNFAYAFAGSQAFNIIRSSDSVTCDLNYDGSGQLFNLTTASCSNAGASNGQAPDTFCNATTCKAVTIYNQTGVSRSFTQATDASRFTLDFTCGKNPFCLQIANGRSMATSSYTPPSAVATLNTVGQRNTNTQFVDFLRDVGSNNTIFATSSGSNTWSAQVAGSSATCGANCAPESSFHSAVSTMNGASTAFTVDSNTTTRTASGSTTGSTIKIDMGSGAAVGLWLEAAYLASTGMDATARAAVVSNQRACWAF